jgi:flagellar motor switch protein FliN/FliY
MTNEADNLAANLEAEAGGLSAVPSAPAGPGGGDAAPGGGGVASGSGGDGKGNLELILDIPLKVTAELGRTRMAVADLLNLGQGMVVELQKLAGEPMEILVNDKLVARGEAVVVNEKFGVRITDILSQEERVKGLGK